MNELFFINCRIILPDSVIDNHYIHVKDGIISEIEEGIPSNIPDEKIVDCKGNYLSPGFIDTHCHGGGGADFMDGSKDDIVTACRAHLMHGTTGICPTTLTCSNEELFTFFENYESAKSVNYNMPHLLGIHLEGPYFNPEQAGAQPPKYLVSPQKEDYLNILEKGNGNIVKWSVAPELDGAIELGDELKKRGILASMGHSNAKFDVAKEAIEHGYTMLTHFYSAMSSIIREKGHRKLGLVEAGYIFDDLNIEIIADGVHLPPELLKMIVKMKDHNHICLVTDSMRGADMPDGPSLLGSTKYGVPVIIQDGIANMPDFTCFAGSVATTDRLVRVMVKKAGLEIWDAVKMASYNPAKFLNVDDKFGSIAIGKTADLLIYDDDINILSVYVSGIKQK